MARVLLLIDNNNPFPLDLTNVLSSEGYDIQTYDITNKLDFDSESLYDADICVVSLPASQNALITTGWMLGKYKKVVAYASKEFVGNSSSNVFEGVATSSLELLCLIRNILMKFIRPIDLGLSVLWADRNLGASNIDEFGIYVRWDQRDKRRRTLVDQNGRRVEIPKGWRLPTEDDFCELMQQCQKELCINNEAKFIAPNGESIIFKYGAFYSANRKILPEPNNSCGLFLSSTFNQWNGNIKFLFCGLTYGRYQCYLENNGDDENFINVRLVKEYKTNIHH